MIQPLPSSAYAGHFGIAHVGHELYRLTGDERARAITLSLADALLHDARRHGNGMVAHDDSWDRAIPDIGFFVVETLMRAAELDAAMAGVYRAQAVRQLRLHIRAFLDPELGLARTMLFFPESKVGKTFWSRATGWLAWSLTAVLRSLPPDDPDFDGFCQNLNRLAHGVAQAVDNQGALHVHVNDHGTPPENTGTAMTAIALHESARNGWIEPAFLALSERMWTFNLAGLSDDGLWTNVYIKWALPAEEGETDVATVDYQGFGPSMGCLLWAAAEFFGEYTQPKGPVPL
jgi:rhamnogalacturonyl hydrolase YesR